MEYRTLGKTGLKVPALSYGASSLGSEFRQIDQSEGIRAVHVALDLGINFLDVAPYYGRTKAETVLGKALVGVPRDRYLLETKVGRYDTAGFDFTAERVKASVDESLERLGVDYVDIIHCHDIEFTKLDQIVNETLPALREVVKEGKARFVGITGLPVGIFPYVMARADVDAILSYCRYTLNDTSLVDILPTLEDKGVGIINASPLSMRLLSQRGAPDWHPASAGLKAACTKAADFCSEQGVDISKLAIQYAVANPRIHTTLVGTANPANMEKNVSWAEEPLDQDLLAAVLKILEPVHNETWPSGLAENN